jgi:serine/threonine protein kinase
MVAPMLRPGDSFERYRVDELIGQGGMGCVYRAHDARLGRRVALKVISDGAASPEKRALQRRSITRTPWRSSTWVRSTARPSS